MYWAKWTGREEKKRAKRNRRKIEKVLSIKRRRISKCGMAWQSSSPNSWTTQALNLFAMAGICCVYLYVDVNVTVTEITMHDWTNEENAKSQTQTQHSKRTHTREKKTKKKHQKKINNSYSITSAIAWNEIRLLSIAIIVQHIPFFCCLPFLLRI